MNQDLSTNTVSVEDAVATTEGDGVDVNRLFPLSGGRMNYDPFVLFDHFDLKEGRGFPTHPHRGFEAITYLFEGGMQHIDNLGNESIVSKGGAQRFTAGRGIEHSEMPQGNTSGIQLWINLPARLKNTSPDYQAVDQAEIPVITFDGGVRRIIMGASSPLRLLTEIRYEEISLDKGGEFAFDVVDNNSGFIYLLFGEVDIEGKTAKQHQVVYFNSLHKIHVKALVSSRMMLCMGTANNEAIHQHGPFVD